MTSRPWTTDTELEQGAVYLSPTGRRCRLACRPWGGMALLLYDLPDGRPAPGKWCPGFPLSRANWRLLRRAPA